VEASHVRLRERVFAVCDRAEPGNPPARGTEKITDGGGMSTGCDRLQWSHWLALAPVASFFTQKSHAAIGRSHNALIAND